jgi:hypothetical protein
MTTKHAQKKQIVINVLFPINTPMMPQTQAINAVTEKKHNDSIHFQIINKK